MSIKIVKIDSEKCIGCNTCPLLDPDTFEMDATTMTAKVKNPSTITDKTTMAISSCPVSAVTIVEE